jgi:regulator of replication initiation timing
MSNSLERLTEMVRQAEAKTRAQKLGSETQQAAGLLEEAERRARAAEARLKQERPVLQRALALIAEDELRLKDLTRKVAMLMGTASLSADEGRTFEQEIAASRIELEGRRRESQAALDAVMREASDARRHLQASMEAYQILRRELDRLQPQLAADFMESDNVARAAESLTPAGQVKALARELEDAHTHFGELDPREQLAQLTIWIGRFRRLQSLEPHALTEEEQQSLQRIFPRLVGISKQYEPGYIEAFRQTFSTDWEVYIAEAEEALRVASEGARARRDQEHRRRESQVKLHDLQQKAREDGEAALDELRGVLTRCNLPDEGLDEFHDALDRAIAGLGAGHIELLELVSPYRDQLTGGEYRALRKHLDRLRADEERDDSALQDAYKDLVEQTRDKRALMIGGSAREDSRRMLQRVFEFQELDWESYESSRPALLDSLEQRIQNRSVDLVLILKSFIGHHVPERLRPICEQAGVSCLMIERGYGPAQLAETLRKGLLKVES